jgi:hypothetical protein
MEVGMNNKNSQSHENRKKLKVKLFIVLSLIFLIIFSFIKFYSLPIPIYTKLVSKSVIENYLNTENIEVKYDSKNNQYSAYIGDRRISYDHNMGTIYDSLVDAEIQKEADKLYTEYVNSKDFDNLELPEGIITYTSLNPADGTIARQKLYYLGVLECKDLNEEDSKNSIKNIVMDIIKELGNEFYITDLQFLYGNLNNVYEVDIHADSSLSLITESMIESNIIQKEEDQLSMKYLEWRDKNKK